MSDKRIFLDADNLRRQIEAMLLEFPELREDEQLRLDTLEGETEAKEILERLVGLVRDAETMEAATADRIGKLKARQDAFERRADGYRQLIHRIMDAAGIRKMQLPEATLSIRPSGPAVRILDEAAIPEEFWRIKREPNRVAIKAALLDGVAVPGVSLSNSSDVLSVRT